MTTFTWIHIILLVLVIGYILWRDVYYRSEINLLDYEIEKLQLHIKHIYSVLPNRCNVETSDSTLCSDNGHQVNLESVTMPFLESEKSTIRSSSSSSSSHHLISNSENSNDMRTQKAILYDTKGYTLITLYVFTMLFESNYLHASFLNELSIDNTVIPTTLIAKLRMFLYQRLPITNLFTLAILFFGSWIAYFGIFNMDDFVYSSLKILLLASSSLPLALMINNFIMIVNYIPNTFEGWITKGKDLSFWIWILSKIFAFDDLFHFIQTMISIVISYVLVWPFRYLFYYKAISFHESSKVMNIFIINMLIHVCFIWIWVYYLTIYTLGTPILLRTNTTLKYFGNSFLVIIFSGLQLVNICIFLFRLIWFVFVNWGCGTWYSYFIILSMIVTYILAMLCGIPLFGVYMQRVLVDKDDKQPFVDQFISKAIESERNQSQNNRASEKNSDDEIKTTDSGEKETLPNLSIDMSEEEKKELANTALSMFEFILDRSTIIAMFLSEDEADAYEKMSAASSRSDEGREKNSKAFGGLLKIIFNQTGYSVAKSLSTQQTTEQDTGEQEQEREQEE